VENVYELKSKLLWV